MTNRRSLLATCATFALLPLGLTACSSSAQDTVNLAQAKAYLDDGAGAVLAGAQQYLAGPPKPSAAMASEVSGLAATLESIKTTLDATTTVPNWQAGAIEALATLQQLSPLVSSYMGQAGTFIPLVIAVVQAAIQSLPSPPNAPPTPPAALARKALQYHRGYHWKG